MGTEGGPGIEPEELLRLAENVEAVKAEVGVQFKRVAQMQAQLDTMLKALRALAGKVG
jgi:hypothetical protein